MKNKIFAIVLSMPAKVLRLILSPTAILRAVLPAQALLLRIWSFCTAG